MKLIKACLLAAIMLSLIIGFWGCTVKKPEMPTWDTTWNLSLTDKVHTVDSLLNKLEEDSIHVDTLYPYFRITRDVETIYVEDYMSYESDINDTIDNSLGLIALKDIEPQSLDLTSDSLGILVNPIPVPIYATFTFNLPQFDEFTYVCIETGIMSIRVSNDLGFDFDSLKISILNPGSTDTIGATDFIGGLAQDSTKIDTISLDGDSLSNSLVIVLDVYIPAQPISGGSNNLEIVCSFGDSILISQALTEIPQIERDFVDTLDLNSSSFITEALIDTGGISIDVNNETSFLIHLEISLPNFTKDGDTLSWSGDVNAHALENIDIDLDSCLFEPDTSPDSSQTIYINVLASIDSTNIQYTIRSIDYFNVAASISNISFTSVTGIYQPETVDLPSTSLDIEDIPEFLEDAQLTNAVINFTLVNSSNASALLDILISANTGNEIVVQDTVFPGTTVIQIPPSETRSFFNPPPDFIEITGTAIFNPTGEEITLSDEDYISGEIEFKSPLAFVISDTVTVKIDSTEEEIGDEDMPDFEDTFVFAVINTEIISGLPIGMSLEILISSTRGGVADSIIIGPFNLTAAETDDDGFVIDSIVVQFVDTLTSDEILVFDADSIIVVTPQVRLFPTGSDGAYFRSDDYIHMVTNAILTINFGDHLWEDDDEGE